MSNSSLYAEDEMGMLRLLAPREDRYIDLEGRVETNERLVTVATVPADVGAAVDIWRALGAYLADQGVREVRPPGQSSLEHHTVEDGDE